MSQKLLNSLDHLLQRLPLVNFAYSGYKDFLIKKLVKQSLLNSSSEHTFVSSQGESLTSLNDTRIELISNAIFLKKEECITDNSKDINLYPIYSYLLNYDNILAEMFKNVIEDEYENDSNAISAYNIIYRDSKAFQDLETEVFDEMLKRRDLLHND